MSHNGQDRSGRYFKLRPARLRFACPGQIRKQSIYYENYTMIWGVKYHVRPANNPTTRNVVLCNEKVGRACRSGCR